MSTDIYIDLEKDGKEEFIRIGHAGILCLIDPLYDQLRDLSYRSPILDPTTIHIIRSFVYGLEMRIEYYKDMDPEEYSKIFGCLKPMPEFWKDSPTESSIWADLIPFLGWKWRMRID